MPRNANQSRRAVGILIPMACTMTSKIADVRKTRPATNVKVGSSLIATPLKKYEHPIGSKEL